MIRKPIAWRWPMARLTRLAVLSAGAPLWAACAPQPGWTAPPPPDQAAATRFQVVQAERFVLSGKDGLIRGEMTLGPDEAPVVVLYDKATTPRAILGLRPDGSPSLALYDSEGRARTGLNVDPDGTVALRFLDSNGRTNRARVSVDSKGTPRMDLCYSTGEPAAVMTMMPSGGPGLMLNNVSGHPVASARVDPAGTWSWTVYDAAGAPAGQLPPSTSKE